MCTIEGFIKGGGILMEYKNSLKENLFAGGLETAMVLMEAILRTYCLDGHPETRDPLEN